MDAPAERAPFFTVCTPTYQRAATLGRVRASLEAQTFRDFEWIVVDDGSTDGTRELVAGWQPGSSFPIRYAWQENAHKKTAFNRGVREARGELFLCADSDDELTPRSLEILHAAWTAIPAERRSAFSGVCGLCVDPAGRVVGDPFPSDPWDGSPLEIVHRHRVHGEKWGATRTDLLRAHPFPEDVKGHVPEGLVWSALARTHATRFVNAPVRVYHDSPDSIMRATTLASVRANAEGHALWAREALESELDWFRANPSWFLRLAAQLTRFRWHARSAGVTRDLRVRSGRARALVALAWPLGVALWARDRVRRAAPSS